MKHILIISGKSDQKNRFAKFVRFDLNLYVRHRNAYDNLERAARLLGCTANKKEKKFYDQMLELLDWSNEHWNFKYSYVVKEIQDFLAHEKAQLLVLHGLENEAQMIKDLNDKFGVETVLVVNETPLLSTNKFDYVLCVNDPDFEDQVKKMLGLNLPEMEAKLKSENQN